MKKFNDAAEPVRSAEKRVKSVAKPAGKAKAKGKAKVMPENLANV